MDRKYYKVVLISIWMRILLSKKSRKEVFEYLKDKEKVRNFKELAKKIHIPFKTLQKWVYGERYIPDFLIPNINDLDIIDSKEDNWGQIKGGKIGGKKSIENLKKIMGDIKYKDFKINLGKKNMNSLWKKYGSELIIKAIKGKIRKREKQSLLLEKEYEPYFKNELVTLDLTKISYSLIDKKKKIKFQSLMSKELAEEIGIHLGDGCMSKNRNYFSVKTNKKEEKYVTNFLFPLYKNLYNLDIKLMRLESVSGFEIYSKALCEFKNISLGLPYGEKVHRIKVPEVILRTKDKEIYRAFIRGLFDTDGCISIIKKDYPVISIMIRSEKFIEELSNMLKMMGFISNYTKDRIYINGNVMLKKWIKEINSNNPVKIEKLKWASRIVDNTQPCGG